MKMMNAPILMKLIATLLVSSLLTTASITKAQEKSKQQPVLVDTIIAVVNSEVITLKELEDRLKLIERRMQREKIQMPARDVLKGQLLERMIVNRAQIQLAKESGIRVDDIMLDRSVARIAEQNNLSIQTFLSETCGLLTTDNCSPLIELIKTDIENNTRKYIENKIYHPIKL